MGSTGELCWTAAAELFTDLDLDDLYARQVRVLDSVSCRNYPYLVLVYTGKITIGISLGERHQSFDSSGKLRRAAGPGKRDGSVFSWSHVEESSE
jgi:hypothetical protein